MKCVNCEGRVLAIEYNTGDIPHRDDVDTVYGPGVAWVRLIQCYEQTLSGCSAENMSGEDIHLSTKTRLASQSQTRAPVETYHQHGRGEGGKGNDRLTGPRTWSEIEKERKYVSQHNPESVDSGHTKSHPRWCDNKAWQQDSRRTEERSDLSLCAGAHLRGHRNGEVGV